MTPRWGPDGNRIVFASNRAGNSDIYIVSVDGTGLQRLVGNAAEDGDPSWSPDGSRIVFYSDRDGQRDIYKMNVDGSGLQLMASRDSDDVLCAGLVAGRAADHLLVQPQRRADDRGRRRQRIADRAADGPAVDGRRASVVTRR